MKHQRAVDDREMKGTNFWRQPQLSRRLFFRHATTAVGGYFLMPSRPMETVAKAGVSTIGTAKNCIFVLMSGGPSHSDTFDLKEGPWTPSYFRPASYDDIRWPQGIMPKLAEQLDAISVVRSVRAWAAVHELARTWIQIGRNPISGLAKIAPHIGSVVSLERSTAEQVLPSFVSLNNNSGPGAGYLRPEHSPFYVTPGGNGLANTTHRDGNVRFDRRYELMQALDAEVRDGAPYGASLNEMAAFNLSARRLMYNDTVNRVFALDQAARSQYGNNSFGNACLTARNLLRANIGTRFIQITLGGWDQHQNIYAPNAGIQSLTRQFDDGLGQLMADLRSDGLLDETLIVAMGEFGRTVGTPNNQNGRDHFLQQSVLMAGAKIRGKKAIGATDELGRATTETGWSRDRDVRAEDIEATIYSALGINWTTIRRDDPLGRGFEYVPFADRDLYGPVHELWGG